MGSIILRIEELYILWEIDLRAPTVVWRSLAEMQAYYLHLYGESCRDAFAILLKRLERTGTTDPEGMTPEEVIRGNRLGPNEREFTLLEVYAHCRSLPAAPIYGDKWDLLLHAAQELCFALTEDPQMRSPRFLRACRDLAVHCGCTHVPWWDPHIGESRQTEAI